MILSYDGTLLYAYTCALFLLSRCPPLDLARSADVPKGRIGPQENHLELAVRMSEVERREAFSLGHCSWLSKRHGSSYLNEKSLGRGDV